MPGREAPLGILVARRSKDSPPDPVSPAVQAAQQAEATQTDELTAYEIYSAMALEREQSQLRLASQMAEFQTDVFEAWQQVIARRQKVEEELAQTWVKLLTH